MGSGWLGQAAYHCLSADLFRSCTLEVVMPLAST